MTTLTPVPVAVIGGVDTHADVHVAAACDPLGGLLGTQEFATTPAGYRALLAYLSSFGPVRVVGVEGTGSYGSGLARYFAQHGVPVFEVDRLPPGQHRDLFKGLLGVVGIGVFLFSLVWLLLRLPQARRDWAPPAQ